MSIIYGPVPSRRLGRSLGINNIPPKTCSYSCIYCQLGKTTIMTVERKAFYKAEDVAEQLSIKVKQAEGNKEEIDFLTFVPDGEPTLDAELGREIELLKNLNMRIAVITNASLLWQEEVRRDLLNANWVSIKVDAVSQRVWQRINRPHVSLDLKTILQGVLSFGEEFGGILTTETMLVRDVNDGMDEITKIADFLKVLMPETAYLAVPTRPPAESSVNPVSEKTLVEAYHIFSNGLSRVEYLIGYEGNAFATTGDVQSDILNITSVHPMREDAVMELLNRTGSSWHNIQKLIDNGSLIQLEYRGHKFYMSKLPKLSY